MVAKVRYEGRKPPVEAPYSDGVGFWMDTMCKRQIHFPKNELTFERHPASRRRSQKEGHRRHARRLHQCKMCPNLR